MFNFIDYRPEFCRYLKKQGEYCVQNSHEKHVCWEMHSYLFFDFVPDENTSMCSFGKTSRLQKLSFITPEKQIKKKKVN